MRDREITGANYREIAERASRCRSRAAALRRLGRPAALPAEGEPARLLSLHRRRLPLPARGRGPDPDVRRRGHARSAPTAASTTSRRASRRRASRPPSTRSRSTARTRHERPDIYGKVGNSGVSIATLDDAKKLYSGFDLCDADDLGLDDDQRPGADHPRLLHERGDRPAGREAPARERPAGRRPSASSTSTSPTGRGPATRASCRRATTGSGSACSASPATRWSTAETYERIKAETLREVRGTVQADILKEDQAQNTCIFSTEFALKMMGDVQQYFVDQRGAQLLQRLDQRVPHRRGRGEPDLPARVHARQRLHDRRVLPGARHGHRRLRAQPHLLLLATGWTPSTR